MLALVGALSLYFTDLSNPAKNDDPRSLEVSTISKSSKNESYLLLDLLDDDDGFSCSITCISDKTEWLTPLKHQN